MGDFFVKVKEVCGKGWDFIKDFFKKGYDWLGLDGILNLESAALITLILMVFFDSVFSMATTFILMAIKCVWDAQHGHLNEKHDLVCACLGVVMGAILGICL